MITWLLDKLSNDARVIKKAWLSFSIACILALIIAFFFCHLWFDGLLTMKSNTIQAYKERVGDLSSLQPKKGHPQILLYTNESDLEKLVPPDTNAAALTYPFGHDGPGALFRWDIKAQKWD